MSNKMSQSWLQLEPKWTFAVVMMRCVRVFTFRDNEDAYVSVNGKTCWTKTGMLGTSGTQQCGGFYKEERFRVTDCYITLPTPEVIGLTVRVWTNLDGEADDESFAIDNVVIKNTQQSGNSEMDNKFDNEKIKTQQSNARGATGLFEAFDADKNGMLSLDEFKILYESREADPGDQIGGDTSADEHWPLASARRACPKCGINSKSKKRSCCFRGGAWFKKCGDLSDSKFEHTWSEGFEVCKGQFLAFFYVCEGCWWLLFVCVIIMKPHDHRSYRPAIRPSRDQHRHPMPKVVRGL